MPPIPYFYSPLQLILVTKHGEFMNQKSRKKLAQHQNSHPYPAEKIINRDIFSHIRGGCMIEAPLTILFVANLS